MKPDVIENKQTIGGKIKTFLNVLKKMQPSD